MKEREKPDEDFITSKRKMKLVKEGSNNIQEQEDEIFRVYRMFRGRQTSVSSKSVLISMANTSVFWTMFQEHA